MKSLRNWLYYVGILLMFGVFLAEIYFLVPETTAYVLIVLATLALSRNVTMAVIPATIATILLVTGFAFKAHNEPASMTSNYVNDFIGLATIWVSVVITIRYRKSLHNEVRQREIVDSLFLYANEAILMVNESGNITMANPSACIMFDYSTEELIAQKIEMLIPAFHQENHHYPESQNSEHAKLRTVASRIELEGKRSNSKTIPLEVSRSSFELDREKFVVVFVKDISYRKENENRMRLLNAELEDRIAERTQQLSNSLRELKDANELLADEVRQRKKSERQLENSQRLYTTIASNFPDGWIGILDETFTYIFASGQGIHESGIYPPELVGKKFADGKKLEDLAPLLRESLNNNRVMTFEMQCEGHSCEVTAQPFINSHGNDVLVVVHDITKQKKRQDALISALEKEKELGQLKSRFVTMASHEFRTPLTTILSSAFLLENYSGDRFDKMKSTHVDRIKRAANLLTEVLDDFLSLSKLEEGKMIVSRTEMDIVHFLNDFESEMQQHKRAGQLLTFTHHGNAVINSDKKFLYHILSNLVGNAIKYSGDGGVIRVESMSEGNSLAIKVTDNGIGIPPEDQKYLFERFFRANNVDHIQGTGLGLHITKKYVQLLDGSISFESGTDKGSKFMVKLPLSYVEN